ncbi:hypothetical protein TNCV_1133721 [Trichonephila clavipes]|nr:hypothetical protein TNCV_1133721 [Trichonephila clavipes]
MTGGFQVGGAGAASKLTRGGQPVARRSCSSGTRKLTGKLKHLKSQNEAHGIHRGKGQEVRLSLALALSTIQVIARIISAKFPEGTINSDTTYLHLHNFGMELKGRKYSPVPCSRDSAHKTFGPTDLTSTYSVCTRRVFRGIGHRTQPFRSGVRCEIGYPRP